MGYVCAFYFKSGIKTDGGNMMKIAILQQKGHLHLLAKTVVTNLRWSLLANFPKTTKEPTCI